MRYEFFAQLALKPNIMNTEQQRKVQQDNALSDKDTDVTRTQNREAVADEAGHPARAGNAPGNAAGDGERKTEADGAGTHREGNYDKNEPQGSEVVGPGA